MSEWDAQVLPLLPVVDEFPQSGFSDAICLKVTGLRTDITLNPRKGFSMYEIRLGTSFDSDDDCSPDNCWCSHYDNPYDKELIEFKEAQFNN